MAVAEHDLDNGIWLWGCDPGWEVYYRQPGGIMSRPNSWNGGRGPFFCIGQWGGQQLSNYCKG